jgi:hypothetical protein
MCAVCLKLMISFSQRDATVRPAAVLPVILPVVYFW